MSVSSKKPAGHSQSIQALMRKDPSRFGQILKHARLLNQLDHVLQRLLEPGLSSQCQVAEFRDQCLILVCSSAAVASRLRMISQHLLESFAEEGVAGIAQIELRVAPVNRPQSKARQRQALSPAAMQALSRFASDSGDENIQAIFERINSRRNRE
jgi:hypothetical protein